MLSLRRFRRLAESYGGDLERWPVECHKAAMELAGHSAAARQILAEAERLDSLVLRAGQMETAWIAAEAIRDESGAALARIRAGVNARIADVPTHRPRVALPGSLFAIVGSRLVNGTLALRWAGATAGTSAILLAGLWVGWMQATSGSVDLLGALQVGPFGGFSW